MKKLSTDRLGNLTKVTQLIRGSLTDSAPNIYAVLFSRRKVACSGAGRDSEGEVSRSQAVESPGRHIKELPIMDAVKGRKSRIRRVSCGPSALGSWGQGNYCCTMTPKMIGLKQPFFFLTVLQLGWRLAKITCLCSMWCHLGQSYGYTELEAGLELEHQRWHHSPVGHSLGERSGWTPEFFSIWPLSLSPCGHHSLFRSLTQVPLHNGWFPRGWKLNLPNL